jgi:hypothetical protein
MGFVDHSSHLALDRDRGVSFDVADRADLDRHIPLNCGGNQNRYGFTPSPASSPTLRLPAG